MADRVKSGEVKIKYCPTDDMIGDYFTKLQQGDNFRKFREQILYIQPGDDYLNPTSGFDPQECVGE